MSATDPGKNAIYAMRNRDYRVSRGGMRPTSASCVIQNEFGDDTLVGKCHRAEWYRLNGIKATDPPTDRSFGIFAAGIGMEDYFQNMWKNQGVLLAGSVINYGAVGDDPRVIISGESDIILRDFEMDDDGQVIRVYQDRAFGIEMKTCRGHFAQKEIFGRGNKKYPMGKPKMEHIMQTAMYLMMRKRHEDHYGVTIPYYLIFYFDVADGTYVSFKISLSNGYDGDILVETLDGKTVAPDPVYGLTIGEPVVPWSGLTTDNILARYSELADKLELPDPPEREYQLRYNDTTARRKFAIGDLSKTKFAEWEKKPLAEIGDWQCSYCDFKSHCYPVSVLTADVESGILTVNEAMAELGYDV
jgi:CRISPR/Cas system-associated exonuclease Cas4 (RecB family)